MMAGNFSVLWLYSKYLGLNDPIPIEDKYKIVQKTLKENFAKVYDVSKFEESWDEIAKELNVTPAPRLQSNRAGENYSRIVKFSNLSFSNNEALFIKQSKYFNFFLQNLTIFFKSGSLLRSPLTKYTFVEFLYKEFC